MNTLQNFKKRIDNDEDNVQLTVLNGSEDLNAYFDQKEKAQCQSVQELVAKMSSSNVDLTLLGNPVFASNNVNISGKKFQVNIFVDSQVLAIVKGRGEIGSIVQIWNGSKNMIVPLSVETLEDACLDWKGKACLDQDDLVSQSICALRLNFEFPALSALTLSIAHNNSTVDADGCSRVWN